MLLATLLFGVYFFVVFFFVSSATSWLYQMDDHVFCMIFF